MGAASGESRSLADQPPAVRRRALLRVFALVIVTWTVVLGVYFMAPIGEESTVQVVLRLVVDLAVLVVFIWWQSVRIVRARYPELRAAQGLGAVVVLFIALFAALYLAMSRSAASTFNEPLDHMRALYFATTVFASVGFGDITAKTDGSQAVVTTQMILDLVIIGAVARVLLTAARTGRARRDSQSESNTR
jgi:voltage-gated potassium channel